MSSTEAQTDAIDPGCVKTQCCCYDSPVILREESMRRFVEEADRGQWTLLPECLDDFIDESNPVRVIDVFVEALDLAEMSFEGAEPAAVSRLCRPSPTSAQIDESRRPRRCHPFRLIPKPRRAPARNDRPGA